MKPATRAKNITQRQADKAVKKYKAAQPKDPSDDVYWVELGFLPVQVGYVPNAKAWGAMLVKMQVDPTPYPTSDARCTWWDRANGANDNIILIVLGERVKDFSVSQVAGLIAHECQHAWRHIKIIIGEKKPSKEFEAYVLQILVQNVMFAHGKKRRAPWRKT